MVEEQTSPADRTNGHARGETSEDAAPGTSPVEALEVKDAAQIADDVLHAVERGDKRRLSLLLDSGGGELDEHRPSNLHVNTNRESLEFESGRFRRDSVTSVGSVNSIESDVAAAAETGYHSDVSDESNYETPADPFSISSSEGSATSPKKNRTTWARHLSYVNTRNDFALGFDYETTIDNERDDIRKYCLLYGMQIRQAWPLYISGSHIKLHDTLRGEILVKCKLQGKSSKVLLDQDCTSIQRMTSPTFRFTDPLLIEVPTSSAHLELDLKHIFQEKLKWLGSIKYYMKSCARVTIHMKDLLQAEEQRIHEWYHMKGLRGSMFVNMRLLKPYMNTIALMQLGSEKKLKFGNSQKRYRKILSEEGEEVFGLLKVKYRPNRGVQDVPGVTEDIIRGIEGCFRQLNFDWRDKAMDSVRVHDVLVVKCESKGSDLFGQVLAMAIKYMDKDMKTCFQIVHCEHSPDDEEQPGTPRNYKKNGACTSYTSQWCKWSTLKLNMIGKGPTYGSRKGILVSDTDISFEPEFDRKLQYESVLPDAWTSHSLEAIPHNVGSWIVSYPSEVEMSEVDMSSASFDGLDKERVLEEIRARKRRTFAKCELYMQLHSKRTSQFCFITRTLPEQYSYRGMKLEVSKEHAKYVPAYVALAIVVKECECRDGVKLTTTLKV